MAFSLIACTCFPGTCSSHLCYHQGAKGGLHHGIIKIIKTVFSGIEYWSYVFEAQPARPICSLGTKIALKNN